MNTNQRRISRRMRRKMSSRGYCEHGNYVGGIGIDWMCHQCEMGYTMFDEFTNMKRARPEFAVKFVSKRDGQGRLYKGTFKECMDLARELAVAQDMIVVKLIHNQEVRAWTVGP